jgi:hypothetical protein
LFFLTAGIKLDAALNLFVSVVFLVRDGQNNNQFEYHRFDWLRYK